MAKVAIIIADQFEDSEYVEPAAAFRAAGHQLVHVGLRAGETVRGKKKGTEVTVEQAVAETSADDFDALLIPGGHSPDNLRADPRAVAFVKGFMTRIKPVFSICHGPQLLITARVLEGRKVTGWKSIVEDIKYAGGEYLDQEVVIDNNLVSSRSPADLPAFIEASLAKLAREPTE
ncbi:MAG: type 1 glutamine amidotransferase domain-containing protein [Desulfurivibrionaceae bacterium]